MGLWLIRLKCGRFPRRDLPPSEVPSQGVGKPSLLVRQGGIVACLACHD